MHSVVWVPVVPIVHSGGYGDGNRDIVMSAADWWIVGGIVGGMALIMLLILWWARR